MHFQPNPVQVANAQKIEGNGSVRNKSLNSREMGGAGTQSLSNQNLNLLEDVTSLKDLMLGKGKIGGGSVIGTNSVIWPNYSVR